jgi:Ca-activated chloride channel homolog
LSGLLVLLIVNFPVIFAQDKLPLPPPPPPEPTKERVRKVDPPDEDDTGTIRIKSELVLIDVAVLDRNNKFVQGMDRNRFQIFEDQIAQKIEFFSQEQVPVSYGIVVDTSGSMRRRLSDVIKAGQSLIDLSRAGDEIFIVDAKDSSNIELLEDFTTNLADAKDALDNMIASGGSAILDSIVVSAEYARKGNNRRKALVVVSDGDDRDSTYTIEQTLDKLSEYDVQLYFIGFPDDLGEDGGMFKRSPKKKAVDLINKLTSESGGQAYYPKDLSELAPIAERIAADLRSQYIIGYYPSNQKQDSNFRKIQVKLTDNKEQHAIRTRSGYFPNKDGDTGDKKQRRNDRNR